MASICSVFVVHVIGVVWSLAFFLLWGLGFFFLEMQDGQCAGVILNTKTSEVVESSCRILSLLVVRVKWWWQCLFSLLFFSPGFFALSNSHLMLGYRFYSLKNKTHFLLVGNRENFTKVYAVFKKREKCLANTNSFSSMALHVGSGQWLSFITWGRGEGHWFWSC